MVDFSSSRQRRLLLLGFLLAFTLVLNVSTYVLYTRAKDYLDNELGERLRSIATTLAHTLEGSVTDSLGTPAIDPAAYTALHLVRSENLLSNIVLLAPDGETVLDLSNVSTAGEINPFIELDYGAFTLARSGLSSSTNLYRTGEFYMKSAYAPITRGERVVAILGVEAGATYFDVLRGLRHAIIVIGLSSCTILVLLGFFFYRQSLALDRAHAAVIQGENLATIGRMVAGIAHEIRNPLSIIKTSAERLGRKYKDEDEAFLYISEEVDNLNRILTGYLNFARAEKQEFRPQSLGKIVQRCVMLASPEMEEKSIRLVERIPDREILVPADDKWIQQAVLNLLINARQAIGTGGTIEISLDARAKSAILTVKDDGPGIDPRHLKDVTRPFFTTKHQGSGLGLSIVRNIVEEHQGELHIDSKPKSGTTVTITLPLAGEKVRS